MALQRYSSRPRTRPVLRKYRLQSRHNPRGIVAASGEPCSTSLNNLDASVRRLRKTRDPKWVSRSHTQHRRYGRAEVSTWSEIDRAACLTVTSHDRGSDECPRTRIDSPKFVTPGRKGEEKRISGYFVPFSLRSCQTSSRSSLGLRSGSSEAVWSGVVIFCSSSSGHRLPTSMVASVPSGQG